VPDSPSPGSTRKDEGRREALALHERVWELERRVEKQAQVIEALFGLLKAQGLSPDALKTEMQRIEQEKSAAKPRACIRCGRPMGRRQPSCVYCGEPRVVESPFEGL
jgi:hypothetical protein